jgi:hypothetical protein
MKDAVAQPKPWCLSTRHATGLLGVPASYLATRLEPHPGPAMQAWERTDLSIQYCGHRKLQIFNTRHQAGWGTSRWRCGLPAGIELIQFGLKSLYPLCISHVNVLTSRQSCTDALRGHVMCATHLHRSLQEMTTAAAQGTNADPPDLLRERTKQRLWRCSRSALERRCHGVRVQLRALRLLSGDGRRLL